MTEFGLAIVGRNRPRAGQGPRPRKVAYRGHPRRVFLIDRGFRRGGARLWWGSGLGGGLAGTENTGVNAVSSSWDRVVAVPGARMISGRGSATSTRPLLRHLTPSSRHAGTPCRTIVMVFTDGTQTGTDSGLVDRVTGCSSRPTSTEPSSPPTPPCLLETGLP